MRQANILVATICIIISGALLIWALDTSLVEIKHELSKRMDNRQITIVQDNNSSHEILSLKESIKRLQRKYREEVRKTNQLKQELNRCSELNIKLVHIEQIGTGY